MENIKKIMDYEWNFDEYVKIFLNYMIFKLEEKLDILTDLIMVKLDK